MVRPSPHQKLKSFLIELGKKNGYNAYTGDSQPLDAREKMSRIEYPPDVIWRKSRRGCYVFEIAFTEDWRAIVGEYALSWISDCSRFFLFTLVEDDESSEFENDFLSNLFGVLDKRFKKTTWYYWTLTKNDVKDFDVIERKLVAQLKKWKFI